MANIPKLLYRKPGILRSVYGKEEIGLRDQEFESIVQQKDLKTNEPIIVAEVFGTPGVQTRQPPINYFDQLIQITGQVEVNDEVIHGFVICWYEKDNKQLIIIDSSTLIPQVEHIYQMRDSVFPVLITPNHRPLTRFPEGYTTGIYLALMKSKRIKTDTRNVLIFESRTKIKKANCSTLEANLICFIQSTVKKRSNVLVINYLLDGYDQSVIGIHAALNQPIDQMITTEFDRIPDYNHRLTNRYMFLVGNDGYLCINEVLDSMKYNNSLLKENTYFCCDGSLELTNILAVKFIFTRFIRTTPYRKTIHIIPEGVQYINILRKDCQPLNTGQLKSYIYGWYTVSDYAPKVLELDSIQLYTDLLGQPNPVHSYQPVMVLADINDALIYEHKFNNQVVGHLLFSLSTNHCDTSLFFDIFMVFICLDETNWSTATTLYQLVGECSVNYQKSWIKNQLNAPMICYFDKNTNQKPAVNLIDLTANQLNRWKPRLDKPFTVFALTTNWRTIFLPFINTTPINGWLNVGVNLVERQRSIEVFGLQLPNDYGVTQKKQRV
ncbi:uncharacterized protein LOC128964046 [Oppia nitens]|uniref:uncharacterized protein LOC128964046 n=1 Tax=Oppia nitens TaxID=1686743 RepID=UPI0023DADE51|nr:uncharacterized protein LOC128964046 [Oppia nitens]